MVLESNIFLKEKRYVKIKVQTVAGRSRRHAYIPKEDARFMIIATESKRLTNIVYVDENRGIMIIDILNSFIQTCVKNKKDMTIINLCEVLVDILCNIS